MQRDRLNIHYDERTRPRESHRVFFLRERAHTSRGGGRRGWEHEVFVQVHTLFHYELPDIDIIQTTTFQRGPIDLSQSLNTPTLPSAQRHVSARLYHRPSPKLHKGQKQPFHPNLIPRGNPAFFEAPPSLKKTCAFQARRNIRFVWPCKI